MIIRNDCKNSIAIPEEIEMAIREVGGMNPYEEPMFRLILAEDRYILAAGQWSIWDENVDMDERGGLPIKQIQHMVQAGYHEDAIDEYVMGVFNKTPISVFTGMTQVPLYPYEGFILEKWKPAFTFGTPEEWNRWSFEGQPMAGVFPEYGDYEMVAGPTPYMPTALQCEEAIRQNIRDINEKPRSARQRVILMMRRKEEERLKREKARRDKIDAIVRDNEGSLYNRVSLASGRIRQKLADRAGLKGHYGN